MSEPHEGGGQYHIPVESRAVSVKGNSEWTTTDSSRIQMLRVSLSCDPTVQQASCTLRLGSWNPLDPRQSNVTQHLKNHVLTRAMNYSNYWLRSPSHCWDKMCWPCEVLSICIGHRPLTG